MKREVSPVAMIVVIILAVVVIGGLGWFYLARDTNKPTGQNGPKPAQGNQMVPAQV